MYHRHNLDYKYPDRSDEHMITVKHLRDTHFDEKYNYAQKGFLGWIKRVTFFIVVNLLGIPVCSLRHGAKVYGRKNLKKHKKALKGGAITICNHVLMWDYLCVLKAIRPHVPMFPGWKTNFEGPNGPLIDWAGGIPVPTGDIRAMSKFNKAIKERLEKGKWIHFYPEGSMWFYYPDIRPLKTAVFKYAVKYNKPILPLTISFRPRRGIEKWFSKAPMAEVNIGEPIFPDTSLVVWEAVDKLHKEAYHVMQVMNGINPGDPTYNTDQNIDTYKKTM